MKKAYRLTLKMRLSLLLFVTAIPLTVMMLGILNMIQEYSDSYNRIMSNLKVANEYNIKFKEDMEYSMYRVMIGLIDASQFENGDIMEGSTEYATVVKNPINMIESARYSFGKVIERIPGTDSDIKIKGILSCLDALETAVNRMIDNSAVPGTYGESEAIWENDIKGLCSMIQEYITQYTYYELVKMEELQKQMEEQVRQSVRSFMALLVGVLAVGFGLSTMITKSVTTPINSLRQTAERLGAGDLEIRAKMYDLEEINVLARTFNTMSDEIAGLMEKTKEEQKNLREAELKLHQEQINPHFLYNTLDTMSSIASIQNCDLVSDLCQSLSNIFRYSLDMKYPYATVAREVAHLKNYIFVMNVRMRQEIRYHFDIDEDALMYSVPKISIQPLVENAINHGLKNKRGQKNIYIKIWQEEEKLYVMVKDDGVGMDAEQLNRRLQENDKGLIEEGNSIGLLNINARLKMIYGGTYGIRIESEPGKGSSVYLTVAAMKEDELYGKANV